MKNQDILAIEVISDSRDPRTREFFVPGRRVSKRDIAYRFQAGKAHSLGSGAFSVHINQLGQTAKSIHIALSVINRDGEFMIGPSMARMTLERPREWKRCQLLVLSAFALAFDANTYNTTERRKDRAMANAA